MISRKKYFLLCIVTGLHIITTSSNFTVIITSILTTLSLSSSAVRLLLLVVIITPSSSFYFYCWVKNGKGCKIPWTGSRMTERKEKTMLKWLKQKPTHGHGGLPIEKITDDPCKFQSSLMNTPGERESREWERHVILKDFIIYLSSGHHSSSSPCEKVQE